MYAPAEQCRNIRYRLPRSPAYVTSLLLPYKATAVVVVVVVVVAMAARPMRP
jgi:hypothetical protein